MRLTGPAWAGASRRSGDRVTLRAVGLVGITEAAELAGISHWTLRTWVRRGRVRSWRAHGHVLVLIADVERAVRHGGE